MLVLAPALATQWLKISPDLQHDTQLAFQIAALGVISTTVTSGLRGALEGLERFDSSNINKIILGFCVFALPAVSIWLHGNALSTMTLYLVLVRVAVVLFATYQLRRYLMMPLVSCLTQHIKPLLNYGVWITVTT